MEEPKSYSVIIVPSDHSGTRQFRISRTMVVVGSALAVLLAVVLLTFAVTHLSVLRTARRVSTLEEENAQLREDLARVDELASELEFLSAQRAQIMKMLGNEDFDTAETGGGADALVLDPVDPLADAEKVQQLFADGARQGFAPRQWPVDGDVTREFFPQPEDGRPAHPGLSLEAADGEAVRAAGRGRVVESRLDSDGRPELVLDHGYGFRSVYVGFDRSLVSAGQIVEQGQAIAAFGDRSPEGRNRAGRIDPPALYFEIRVDGVPIDPREYLTPRQGHRRGS